MSHLFTALALLSWVALGLACAPNGGPTVGSQTNWLIACDTSKQCGDLACTCGVCAKPCADTSACDDLPGASCVANTDPGAIAVCGGQKAPTDMCLPRCDDAACPEGTSCLAGICAPSPSPTLEVSIDPEIQFQTLIGFGAGVGFTEGAILSHAGAAELYDLLFEQSGLDVLRLRNRYEAGNEASLMETAQLLAEVSARRGSPPVVLLNAGSPPAELKANGETTCAGNLESCTLATAPEGGFAYAAYGSFWRDTLEAYAEAGVSPDYLGIQNNPNWIPSADEPMDACQFLPVEGPVTVSVDGVDQDVSIAGYAEAISAVRSALEGLQNPPQIMVPETTGVLAVGEYVDSLDPTSFDAIGFHLYGVDPLADPNPLDELQSLAQAHDVPALQTEMQEAAPQTAALIQHSLKEGGASAYLQNDLVATAEANQEFALVRLNGDAFEPQANYDVFAHFARATDPGWVRVDASSETSELLVTAFLAPDESALTIILVNPGDQDIHPRLSIKEPLRSGLKTSQVTRTVFGGLERSALLGALAADQIVRVPGGSILTVAFRP